MRLHFIQFLPTAKQRTPKNEKMKKILQAASSLLIMAH